MGCGYQIYKLVLIISYYLLHKYGIIYLMDKVLSLQDLDILYGFLTKEKFFLADSQILLPIAVKIQEYLKANKPVEALPSPATSPTVDNLVNKSKNSVKKS